MQTGSAASKVVCFKFKADGKTLLLLHPARLDRQLHLQLVFLARFSLTQVWVQPTQLVLDVAEWNTRSAYSPITSGEIGS
jgi:hypothetical protein